MAQVAPVSQQIWDMKYRLKGGDGTPVDKSIPDTWRRVARALAEPEAAAERERWEQVFYEALSDFRFLPAGRIVSGAGSDRNVTLFNCFVMGDIPDDMSGIFDGLKEAALTMQQGGGIGDDFSTLRPKGAPVKGVGADASGPLSFMDVWDAMCRTIMSAGSRRGAMMAVLRCDHPDILDFIAAKREPGRLRMFNLSVLVTDAFMQAVKEDAPWELSFGGVTYKSLPAREIWDKIMQATYAYAEPGVIFIDRINARNNLHYCETIHATNPCVTADTWVHTVDGACQVADLVSTPFEAMVDGAGHRSGAEGFFRTGEKPVVELRLGNGCRLKLTADHRVRVAASKSRYRIEAAWVPAGDLEPGDAVILHNHRTQAEWSGPYGEDEGYLIGLLMGDGTLKADKAVLSVWPRAWAVNGADLPCGTPGVMARAEAAARSLPHRADFAGWVEVAGRGEYRLATAALRLLAHDLGMAPGRKALTGEIERQSSAFYRGFLQGLFDADGSVQGSQRKGVSIRLAQSDVGRLRAVQRMLARLGIASTIYENRRPASTRHLPDGRGGTAINKIEAQHELAISRDNVHVFAERIGFADSDKAERLRVLLAAYHRRPNRERFTADVLEVVPAGTAPVFDVRVPGVNAFDANGLYVHNCGEQPLPPYSACLLGSVNLARLINDPFTEVAALDLDALTALVTTAVRMMDNVIDVSNMPLQAQRHEARAKRRIGLGVTGLADALILCGARYGGAKAVDLTDTWMRTLTRAAYLASVDLAREKGAFLLFDAEKFLQSETVQSLDLDVQNAIRSHGIRNALLTSIAPTGTISLFADNVSSGLEPVFSFKYARHVLMPDGTRREEEVSDYAYRLYHRLHGEAAPLTDAFVDAQALSPNDHLVMQAAVQKHIDSSISKTINVPESISFEDFKDVYMQAFDLGCKGCTTYRPNDVTGAVLEVKGKTGKDEAEPELPLEAPTRKPATATKGDPGAVVQMFRPLGRPGELPGKTYKLQWPESDHAMYITLNDIVDDAGRIRPFEIFINSKNMEHYAWTVALTRMISAVFRRGGDVSFVVEELKAVFDPRGGQWMGGKYVPSLLAALGGVIETHMIDIGFLSRPGQLNEGPPPEAAVIALGGKTPRPVEERETAAAPAAAAPFRQCPKCAQPSLIRQEGCDQCTSCDYSKCG